MSLALDSHDAAVIPVVGYVRVSQVRGREGDSFISPELQREQIAAVARREGLEVAEVIEELDASGGDAKRPGWSPQAIGFSSSTTGAKPEARR
jgi:hypothetical protein